MSSFLWKTIRCTCGNLVTLRMWESVNIELDPDMLGEVLNGNVNRYHCPHCLLDQRLVKGYLFHDPVAKLMIWILPAKAQNEQNGIYLLMGRNYLYGIAFAVYGQANFLKLLTFISNENEMRFRFNNIKPAPPRVIK